MGLLWLKDFICKELYAPFIIDKDIDYELDLSCKFQIIENQAKLADADEESIKIIKQYSTEILKAVACYYTADIAGCHSIIQKLIEDVSVNEFAVSELNKGFAFPKNRFGELQFFRCRLGNPAKSYKVNEMMYLPKEKRAMSGNYRFSIPGNPSLYFANSSYGCWIETGFPSEIDFNVSPALLDGTQKVFNLAVMIRDFTQLNEFEDDRVHCWLKLFMLSIATSYRIKEPDRSFKSEYIISQAIMMACKKLKFDGIAYYSKRVDNESFALCAINLALFVDYNNTEALTSHIKMDDSFNYALYKQLDNSLKYKTYPISSVATGLIINIGNFNRQYPYRETEFYHFDEFLFCTWRDKSSF